MDDNALFLRLKKLAAFKSSLVLSSRCIATQIVHFNIFNFFSRPLQTSMNALEVHASTEAPASI